jgi:hypothetical protein
MKRSPNGRVSAGQQRVSAGQRGSSLVNAGASCSLPLAARSGWIVGDTSAHRAGSSHSLLSDKEQRRHDNFALQFQDAEFEEITIADLPDHLSAVVGEGGTLGGGKVRAKVSSEERGYDDQERMPLRGSIMSFGPQGVKIPAKIADKIEKRRIEEENGLLGRLARDFVGSSFLYRSFLLYLVLALALAVSVCILYPYIQLFIKHIYRVN